jgi:hypothetical protein
VLVAHTYNASYLEDWDQVDHGSKPDCANSWQDPILFVCLTLLCSFIFRGRGTGGTREVKFLLSPHRFLTWRSSYWIHWVYPPSISINSIILLFNVQCPIFHHWEFFQVGFLVPIRPKVPYLRNLKVLEFIFVLLFFHVENLGKQQY